MRITQMNGADVARFEFDLDTTWAAFFTDARLNIYSRFGGRDETASDARLHKSALVQTMQEVLAVHDRRRERPTAGPDEDVHPAPASRSTPEDIPLLKSGHQGCVHCHQVKEYRMLQNFRDGKFARRELFGFPLPENAGLKLDPEHGHRVKELLPDSAAFRGGVRPGDVVTRVNDVPVHSEQDIRWALHRVNDARPVALTVERPLATTGSAETLKLEFSLTGNWRQTELGWRKSLRSVPLPLGFLAYDLGREERRTAKLSENQLAIRVISFRGQGLAQNVGLQKDDLIVKIAGQSAARSFEEFQSDLLRHYQPGDTVQLTVRRNGESVKLEGRFPEWHTDATTVP